MARKAKVKKTDSFGDTIRKKLSPKKSNEVVDKKSTTEAVKQSKIEENDKESLNDLNYKIINKRFPPNFSLDFKVFQTIPTTKKVDKFTERGTRVYVARYPEFYKIYLIKYHDIGSHGFPNGGVTVYNATFEQVQHHPIDGVMLHQKLDKCKIYGEQI